MTAPQRLDSLLSVQHRRVDKALSELTACNEQQRRAELDRAACQERWEATEAQRLAEIDRQAKVIAASSSHIIPAAELAAAGRRLEWWRTRAEEQQQEIETAQAALLQARTAAMEARLRYRRAQARHEGLMKLIEQRQIAAARESLRLEESDTEGRRIRGVGT
jgi:hypothetical protein